MVWEIVDIPGSSSPSSPRTSWDGSEASTTEKAR